jgi:hypothetical protein
MALWLDSKQLFLMWTYDERPMREVLLEWLPEAPHSKFLVYVMGPYTTVRLDYRECRLNSTTERFCSATMSISVADPLGDLPTKRVVDLQSSLEDFIHLVVIHLAVLMRQYIPEPDGRDERVRRFFVDCPFSTKNTNCVLGFNRR